MIRIIGVLGMLFMAQSGLSQEAGDLNTTDPTKVASDVQQLNTTSGLDKIYNFIEWYMKYLPAPYASYSEETSWLFGISKFNAFTFNRGKPNDTLTQPSSIQAFGYLTLNNQYRTAIEANLMFHENRALWRGLLLYTDYPLQYYGVGNNTSLVDERILITTDWQFTTHYLFKTWKKWYVGPIFDYYNFTEVNLQDGAPPMPEDSIVLAHNLGKQAGFGGKLLMEGRDNRLNAKHGFYADISYLLFRKFLGGEYVYDHLLADFRYYTTPYKKMTIAAQFKTEAKTGDVPLQSLAFLGGDYTMRGTYRGRYRDHVSMEMQLELRFPIYWIFGGTLFNSIGQVAPTYNQLGLDRFHYNYGAGLRITVDRTNDINIRIDVGRSNDQTIFILNFGEAF